MVAHGVILLEGADCSGKTTLAEHFRLRFGARYLHGRVFPQMWKYHNAMLRLALRWADTGLVVIDRLHLSELVYGQVYRGGPAYDLGARCVDRVLQRAGAVTVLCAPADQERQLARHADRASQGGERYRQVQRVVAAYAGLRDGNRFVPGDGYLAQLTRWGDFAQRKDVMVYDVDADGDRLVRFGARVLHRLGYLRERQFPPALDSTRWNVAGSAATATHLLVGEARSPNGDGSVKWPWFWDDSLSSVTWLNRCLRDLSFDETRALWTNAVEPECDVLPDLLRLGKRVVCLGVPAARRVRELGYDPHATLNHPQFERRFCHSRRAEYAEKLREALA